MRGIAKKRSYLEGFFRAVSELVRTTGGRVGLQGLCRDQQIKLRWENTPHERHVNQPRSGGSEVSPGRKPRVKTGKISEPRSGGTSCGKVYAGPPCRIRGKNHTHS